MLQIENKDESFHLETLNGEWKRFSLWIKNPIQK